MERDIQRNGAAGEERKGGQRRFPRTRRMAEYAKPLHNEAGVCFYVSHARVLLVIVVFAPMGRVPSLSCSLFPSLSLFLPVRASKIRRRVILLYSRRGIVISRVVRSLRILVKHGRSRIKPATS